jgi:hypothetical protein
MLCLWAKYFISNNSKSGKIIFVIVTIFLLAMATYDAELLFVKSWNKGYLAYKKCDYSPEIGQPSSYITLNRC